MWAFNIAAGLLFSLLCYSRPQLVSTSCLNGCTLPRALFSRQDRLVCAKSSMHSEVERKQREVPFLALLVAVIPHFRVCFLTPCCFHPRTLLYSNGAARDGQVQDLEDSLGQLQNYTGTMNAYAGQVQIRMIC